ncbi:MAG: CPBP family intramembrane metalloprotease [Eggerthellaceae bacterium]|nr:CPBP family intramembrane metalloprotease [Eggerthellaceae bacterium]
MLLTLWHNIVAFVTIFPGVLSIILGKIPPFRRLPETLMFAACATGVVVADAVIMHTQMLLYLGLIAIILISFFIDLFITKWKIFYVTSTSMLFKQVPKYFIELILFPIFEEYIYRFYLYELLCTVNGNDLTYVVVSSILFVVSHVYRLRAQAIVKIPFGLCSAIIYALTINLYACLAFHLAFNFCIYLYNSEAIKKQHIF